MYSVPGLDWCQREPGLGSLRPPPPPYVTSRILHRSVSLSLVQVWEVVVRFNPLANAADSIFRKYLPREMRALQASYKTRLNSTNSTVHKWHERLEHLRTSDLPSPGPVLPNQTLDVHPPFIHNPKSDPALASIRIKVGAPV